MTKDAVTFACLVLLACQAGCSVVHEPVATVPNRFSYRYKDVGLQPIPVSVGYLDEADRWLRECQVSAWVAPVTQNRVLSNYLILLIALRTPGDSPVKPKPGGFAVFFSEDAYKSIRLDEGGVGKMERHQGLLLMLDLGPDQEVWGSTGEELVLESAGNDDDWPWKRRTPAKQEF